MSKTVRDASTDPAGSMPPPAAGQVRIVTKQDLPLSCPMPDAAVWDMHPRVYLPIEDEPEQTATCPYCGARYKLEEASRG